MTRFPCEFDAVSIPTEDGGNMQMMQEEITTEGFGNENVGFDNGNAVMAAFAGGYVDEQQAGSSYEPSQTQFQQGVECGADAQQQQPLDRLCLSVTLSPAIVFVVVLFINVPF